jgi:hypothetical protein
MGFVQPCNSEDSNTTIRAFSRFRGVLIRLTYVRLIGWPHPFVLHQHSATSRLALEGAASFVFQKGTGLDETPAKFPPQSRFSPDSENGTASQK